MKETYYFQHDYNATQDPKLMTLLARCGLEGIGMYWIMIELLHQQNNSKISKETYKDYVDFYGRVDGENEHLLNKIKQVLIDVGLFVEEDGFIFSNRVLENKKQRKEISEKRSFAGKRSAEVRQNLTNDEQVLNSCETKTNIRKEKKGKEIKENSIKREQQVATPSQDTKLFFTDLTKQEEVLNHLKEKGIEEQLARREIAKFISYWTEPNKSGNKQRWELEKAFEITRRLGTWFSRINNFNKQKTITSI